jgi:DNA excision repair protein ERCC-3
VTDDDGDAPGDADTPGDGAEKGAAAPTLPDPAEAPDAAFDAVADALEERGRPVVTADDVARGLGVGAERARGLLAGLVDAGELGRLGTVDPPAYYPAEWERVARRERVILFPEQRRIVAHHPEQFTRAQLAGFARLVDTTGAGAYMYEVREEDVWNAPHEEFEGLLRRVRDALDARHPEFEAWLEDQWSRARQFTLRTHEDGYVVLEADSESLMGNVAREKLPADALRAPISDTESWVAEERTAEVKRVLYEAGYPVADERDLETGDPLDLDLELELRDYQRDWVERFESAKAGVFVGPPGSGKTVAAMGAMASVGGETLVLVPSRELAAQWREQLLANTSLDPEQVGEYHGGTKDLRPVTVATYQIAGMDRHRELFDSREWGLVVLDEVHHVPAPVFRRSTELQSKHRLGLSATPVRGDDREEDIFTLVGPPVGTDWDALFEAGFVAEPNVEIRYLPWGDDDARNEYAAAEGHERRQVAAANPAKVEETRRLLAEHDGQNALVFVDYLDQGEAMAAALGVPFVSGETPHPRRRALFGEFERDERPVLVVSRVGDEGIDLPNAEVAVLASGLGGSRRQGAQRAGRTMRPAGGAQVYLLATAGTREEEFARNRTRHLAEKGVRVTETRIEDRSPGPGDDGGEEADTPGGDDEEGTDAADEEDEAAEAGNDGETASADPPDDD